MTSTIPSTDLSTEPACPAQTMPQQDPHMLVIPTAGAAPYWASTHDQDETPARAISRVIADTLGAFGLGELRVWHCDRFTGHAPNPTADWLLPRLGYRLDGHWHGPVILTMEKNPCGQISAMPPHIVRAIVATAG